MVVMPGGGHEHEPLHALREADRQLGADEAAHRVADDATGPSPRSSQTASTDRA